MRREQRVRDSLLKLISLVCLITRHRIHGGDARIRSSEERRRTSNRRLIPSHLHEKLSEALLEDLLPPVSSKCEASIRPDDFTTTFNFTFSSSEPYSDWYDPAAEIEEYVFLVEMEHLSPDNPDQAWTMRIGKGGNVYSFRGAYGEAIPPQHRTDGAAWVDEVWQSVAVNTDLNGKDGYPYFVHQAGTYDGKEHDNLSIPFYSPTIAVHCSGHSCAVAAWGQQAHLPTKFESSIVYISRYTNCNNGAIEIVSLVHNLGDHEGYGDGVPSHEINFLNLPWAGVRASTLSEMLLSSPPSTTGETNRNLRRLQTDYKDRNMRLTPKNPIPLFDGSDAGVIENIASTGGATVFAQEYFHEDEANFGSTTFTMPCGIKRRNVVYWAAIVKCSDYNAAPVELVLENRSDDIDLCRESKSNTITHGSRVIYCNLEPTVEIFEGCPGCDLRFVNKNTGGNFYVKGIVHWAFTKTQVFFIVEDDVTVDIVNDVFKANERIHVERYERGIHYDNSRAVAFVHGRHVNDEFGGRHPQISASKMRFGRGGTVARDFIVLVLIVRAIVRACQTLVKRQYVITDRLHSMQSDRLDFWSNDVYLDILDPVDFPSTRQITLFASSDLEWFTVALTDEEREACSTDTTRAGVTEVCNGWTTPHEGTSRLLYIRCAGESHVGESFYHFAEDDVDDGHVRPYICDDAEHDRPEVLWLGFFPHGECDAIVDSKIHPDLCDPNSEEPEYIVIGGKFAPIGVSQNPLEEEGAQGFAPPDDIDPEPEFSDPEPLISDPEIPPAFLFEP